jgi:hypothetical protein
MNQPEVFYEHFLSSQLWIFHNIERDEPFGYKRRATYHQNALISPHVTGSEDRKITHM